MPKGHLLLLLMFVVMLGGCQEHIKVEPVSFSHEDEMVREGDFIVLADRRVFATMAFVNAAGYDGDGITKKMPPLLLRVREILKGKSAAHPEQFRRWKKYYDRANLPIFIYQNFTLSLSADYPFRRIRPDSELGYPFAAKRLKDFPAVLNDFWETAGLEEIWAQVKPSYLEEIRKYDFDKMKRQLEFLWNYLKMERTDQFVFVSIPSLLDPHSAMGANYENYWYMVESLRATSYALSVHEYLHSIVNLIVEHRYEAHQGKLDAYLEARRDTIFANSYSQTATYTAECLVRALAARIRILLEEEPSTTKRCESQIRYLTENGLSLVGPFYDLLSKFEQSDESFEEFLPTMLDLLPEYSE